MLKESINQNQVLLKQGDNQKMNFLLKELINQTQDHMMFKKYEKVMKFTMNRIQTMFLNMFEVYNLKLKTRRDTKNSLSRLKH